MKRYDILLKNAPRGTRRRGMAIALGAVALVGAYTSAYAGLRAIVGGDAAPGPAATPAPQPIARSGSTGYFPLPAALANMPAGPAAAFAGGAPAFFLRASATDGLRAQVCLTAAIYYEAASESEDGQRAVAQVVLNRVRHPAFPATVCGVVYQGSERSTGCQFSFTCDGALARLPSRIGWARASRIAREALTGKVHAPVGLATHYHTLAVSPYWAPSLVSTGIVGAHIFYRWPGGAGTMPAFRQAYLGNEPMPVPHSRPAQPARLLLATNPAPIAVPATLAPAQPVYVESSYSIADTLPDSQIRPEWRDSGKPIVR